MLISVIIPSFNYESFISQAIESVLAQTYSNWELIIVDDGSSDNSLDVIRSYSDKDNRIKLFTHENNQNKGLAKTLELGVSKSNGDWIAILESDDMWTKDCLKKRVDAIDKNNCPFIFNTVSFLGKFNKKYTKMLNNTKKNLLKFYFPKNMFSNFVYNNQIMTFSSIMFKKEIVKNIEWNAPIDKLFDWWFYIHLAYENEFYYLDEPLTIWRIHSDSYINAKHNDFILVNLMAYIDVYKKNKSLKLFLLICFFIIKFIFFIEIILLFKRFITKNKKKFWN